MHTNGNIQVNETLTVFLEDDKIAIGREDGGLVTIQVKELSALMDAVARALVSPWADTTTLDEAAYVNALNFTLRELIKEKAKNADLTERLCKKTEVAFCWKISAKEWRQAAMEAQGPSIPVVGVLSDKTTPADFERFFAKVSRRLMC
jgi:hypothetical protein